MDWPTKNKYMIPDVYRYNLPMFYQPPYLDTMPNGTLCGLLAQSVPEGPDVIHNHIKGYGDSSNVFIQ